MYEIVMAAWLTSSNIAKVSNHADRVMGQLALGAQLRWSCPYPISSALNRLRRFSAWLGW